MTRVVHLLFCTGHGGDAFAALRVAREQRRRGHDATLHIFPSEHSNAFVTRARNAGVPAEELAPVPSRSIGSSFPARMLRFWKARARLSGDVLHVHTSGHHLKPGDIAGVNLLPFHTRVVTVQSPADWTAYPPALPVMRRWSCDSRGLEAVICPSERSARMQMFAGLPCARLRVVPNPVEISAFGGGTRNKSRRELGVGEDSFVLLYASRLDEEKRPLDAIRAFAVARVNRPEMVMLIAGSGALETECRALVSELGLDASVRFLGFREDVASLLEAADAFILLTQWESFGMAVAEAMAAGTPVVTTTALEEVGVVEAGVSAMVVDVGDWERAASAIASVVDDREATSALVSAALERVGRYDVGCVVDALDTVYSAGPRARVGAVARIAAASSLLLGSLVLRAREAGARVTRLSGVSADGEVG